jgi:hypothetical protein
MADEEDSLPVVVLQPEARTEYVTREVHVHRAPTDKSVELLRDMEAKARAQVIRSIALTDNGFNCVVQFFEDALSDTVNTNVVFTLNGNRFVSRARVERHKRDDLVTKMMSELSQKIAAEILNEAFKSIDAATMRQIYG